MRMREIFCKIKDKEKKIVVFVNNKQVYINGIYVADGIIYLPYTDKKEDNFTSQNLLYIVENEAKDDCWNYDIYECAMDKLCDCDTLLVKDDTITSLSYEENSLNIAFFENDNEIILIGREKGE